MGLPVARRTLGIRLRSAGGDPQGDPLNPQTLAFEFPLPENLGNHRLHWAVKNKRKLAYFERLDLLVMAKENPKPIARWGKAEAEIQMRTWRQMDQDGAHARLKWCLDWLQTRGYVENDKHLAYTLVTATAPRKLVGITLVLREAA